MKIGKLAKFTDHLRRYFPETVEVVLAVTLLVFGVITLIPAPLLPVGSAYGAAYITKLLFGLFLSTAPFYLLYIRIRYNIHEYVYSFREQRRRAIFVMSLGYLYLLALRIAIAWWPLGYVAALAGLLIICIMCYVRTGR